jgi:peptidoglycan/LPS O-acetylase OafA/YrhL
MIKSLTSFRFITAFVVFIFHCNVHLDLKIGPKYIDQFFAHGAVFMTGFFVLSGFIMSYVYFKTDFTNLENIKNYWIKRVAKIYPVFIFATIVHSIFMFDSFEYSSVFALNWIDTIFGIQSWFYSMFSVGLGGGYGV